MLVDANHTFRRVTTRFLQGQEDIVVVGVASGGEEALAKAQELQPDIVLIDLSMLNPSGLGVISHLRAALPQAGIIVLTLLNPNSYWQAALAAGADDFVPKATMSTGLLPVIRRVMEADRPGEKKPYDEPGRGAT